MKIVDFKSVKCNKGKIELENRLGLHVKEALVLVQQIFLLQQRQIEMVIVIGRNVLGKTLESLSSSIVECKRSVLI